MTNAATLEAGDLLLSLSLPDALGTNFDLHGQAISGMHRVLVLGTEPSEDRLAEAAVRLAGCGGRLFLVAGRLPDGVAGTEGPQRLFDPARRLFAALGFAEGGVAVLTPRGRLGFVGAGETALEEAIATIPPVAAAAEVRRSGAPVLLIPEVLEPALIEALLGHWRNGTKLQGRVAMGTDATGAGAVAGIKRRTDVFLDDRGLYERYQRRLERRVVPELWRAFRFRAASFEAPRIGCYSAEDAGGFGAHRDNRTPSTAHRRFAMSLNLNTGAYEGGNVRFPEFGPEEYEPGPGGCVIFSCDLLHEALPVTKGERFAIFTFLTDAEGAEQERKVIAQAQARGDRGVAMR
jgi:predicted 2-oxoglutarate/Fe(II)-dependent dioxygenase YbiX